MKYSGVGSARSWAWAGVGLSLASIPFCLLGVAQAVWLSATPDFPPERATRNLLIWGTGVVVSVAVLIVSALGLRKHSGR